MALVVISFPTVPGARTAIREFKARTLGLLTSACLLAALPATAQVNYGVYGNTAYVARSASASGDIVIASTFSGFPVTIIVSSAFTGCTNLTSVTIPSSVTSIGSSPFGGCTSLTNLLVDAANPALSSRDGVLFNKEQTTLITFPPTRSSYVVPNRVTSIKQEAFAGCSGLTNVTIGNSVTGIGNSAFSGCTSLASMIIPNSVTGIGDGLFSGCTSLTSVTIGNGVTSIGFWPFERCTSLTNLSVEAANPAYGSLDGVLFDKARTTLIMFPPGRGGYVLPDGVINIGVRAFYVCSSLTNVTIPDSVTSLGNYAFNSCTGLTSIIIPNSVTNIGSGVFWQCTSLTNVTIGNSVSTMGLSAFAECRSVTRVIIPASVTSLGSQAFIQCTGLTNITFLGNPPQLLFDMDAGFAQFSYVGAGAKAYYYCGATGWGSSYGALPTVMLCPPQIAAGSTGVKPSGFGFTLNRLTNQTIVVEACSELVEGAGANRLNWQPIWTNTLPGVSADFVDPEWMNHPRRFYRARSD